MDSRSKLLGIRKTELKLLPHLETKPSSQPQEFQARQLLAKLQVKGGVSCGPVPLSLQVPTRIHRAGLQQEASWGKGTHGSTPHVASVCSVLY